MTHDLGTAVLILTIYFLAVARVTRLINADTILDKPRLWIAGRLRQYQATAREAATHGQTERQSIFTRLARRWQTVHYFVQCPWCVGMWLALATAWIPARLIGWPWWASLPMALAASHLVGVFAFAADTEQMDIEDDSE